MGGAYESTTRSDKSGQTSEIGKIHLFYTKSKHDTKANTS